MDLFAGLHVDIDRLVTTANLDDLAVKGARLRDRPKFFFHVARLTRELNQFRFAPDNAATSVVFGDRKSTRLNSSHLGISYAVFCLKKKTEREAAPERKRLRDLRACAWGGSWTP